MPLLYIALCRDLTNPDNGMASMEGNSVGDTATYTCNAGYELMGAEMVTCENTGEWSADPPVCTRK